MKDYKTYLLRTLFVFGVLFTLSSCGDDDPENPYLEINNWIYNVMDEAYLWTDQIPSSPDNSLEPTEFFESLLYSGDRFSVIYEDWEELQNQLNGVTKEAGYEFQLLQRSSTDVVMLIVYVKPNSPASQAGFKRGDLISKVNGSTITLDNYRTLVPEVYENHTATYERYNEGLGGYEVKGNVNLNVVVYEENPNFMDSVYTIDNRKIGYYIYNFFSPGSNKAYDDEMDAIFSKFKSEGIQDLILDLRYNGGGSVSSAVNLASLIAPDVDTDDIFYSSSYNDLYQNYFESQPDADAILNTRFKSKSDNIGSLIGNNLYVLVSGHTASASELIINGLDPYMNVTIIGETTVGKNVASTLIEDDEDPDNNYGLLPIISRIENSQGFSDYENGFTPLGDNNIDEFDDILIPLGNVDETLFARALELIGAGSTNGRIGASRRVLANFSIMSKSSIDRKVTTNRMIVPAIK
ncbi:S41 family peptidase [Fulvivirga ligni]|uniref:S41 family peptidase n=1 Tax=Fulvivirga ligni TaxID=2904246 RepID=UPI001F3B4F2E|nr:S41 family peptidase [Fulvivirga ligni]UII20192.1 S41 family peptidase [Fulvivirga ligni]